MPDRRASCCRRTAKEGVWINKRAGGLFVSDYRQQVLSGARLVLRAFRRVAPDS
jgi:hypothetical protein